VNWSSLDLVSCLSSSGAALTAERVAAYKVHKKKFEASIVASECEIEFLLKEFTE
jgi:hypothetical protein